MLRKSIRALADTWLGLRGMAPMGFVAQVEPFTLPEEKKIFVAEREGELVGMVALAPLYARGFLLEDLLRNPNAPNGTTEALIDAAMKDAAASDAHYVTLGLAPLALFFRVSLPSAWRGVVAALALGFARAAGEFGATLMFAGDIPGRTNTMPIEIFESYRAGDDARAFGYVVVLSAVSVVVVIVAARMSPPEPS